MPLMFHSKKMIARQEVTEDMPIARFGKPGCARFSACRGLGRRAIQSNVSNYFPASAYLGVKEAEQFLAPSFRSAPSLSTLAKRAHPGKFDLHFTQRASTITHAQITHY